LSTKEKEKKAAKVVLFVKELSAAIGDKSIIFSTSGSMPNVPLALGEPNNKFHQYIIY